MGAGGGRGIEVGFGGLNPEGLTRKNPCVPMVWRRSGPAERCTECNSPSASCDTNSMRHHRFYGSHAAALRHSGKATLLSPRPNHPPPLHFQQFRAAGVPPFRCSAIKHAGDVVVIQDAGDVRHAFRLMMFRDSSRTAARAGECGDAQAQKNLRQMSPEVSGCEIEQGSFATWRLDPPRRE